ncbi:MAG TPA: glycosyltransferase, partial [Acidimicrobiales bacterium]
RHEEAVLGATLDRLAELDYSAFEVLAVVGHDDPGTKAVADAAARRHAGRIRVIVDHSWPKNKPTALNTALAECRGDVVGVFDAEDEVHSRLLRQVAGAFDRSGAHVVQGGVQLVNFQSSWYALRNCLEYFFWFRSRLHLHAERRFIPLGGNTVFVRTDLLQAVGGWDPKCLAEDCELGVRLSSLGARVDVAYDPMLVTREETPGTLRGLLKQRTRWNQGFLQVLRKREWHNLPTRSQRALARYTLAMPFLQAFTGLVIPISIYAILYLKIPVALALISFLPVIPTLAALAFELVGLREFGRVFYVKPRIYDYVRLVLGMFPYQLFLAGAAVRAVVREMLGLRGWEKTAHTGAHRPATAATGASPRAEPVPAAPEPALTMAGERS